MSLVPRSQHIRDGDWAVHGYAQNPKQNTELLNTVKSIRNTTRTDWSNTPQKRIGGDVFKTHFFGGQLVDGTGTPLGGATVVHQSSTKVADRRLQNWCDKV